MVYKSRSAILVLIAGSLFISSLPAVSKEAKVIYPSQLRGIWQGNGNTCRLPGELDSDTRMEITGPSLSITSSGTNLWSFCRFQNGHRHGK